ncbi:MAG: GntR family transcriptional regulator [Mogibacterium sp.]|nr:GntR family transcriptional regulator [Mogibacterium sp.]
MELDLQIQKPLRELVYLELKHKILTGEIVPQTRLMEIDLAEKMNVSRTPIREAIRELAADGLVTIEPRRGAYVSRISIKDLLDVFEVREDLEGLAASLAAQRITEEEKSALRKLTRLYELAIESNNKAEIVEYDEKFHKFVVKCSGNETLIQMVNQIQELSLRFRYLYYDDFSVYEKMPAEHKRIMEAVCDGDAERAREEADKHVKSLKDFIINLDMSIAGR